MVHRRETVTPGFSTPELDYLRDGNSPPYHRTRMPNARTFTGSADLDAMVARIAPAVLGLLADGVPRTKATIAKAFTGRHAEDEVGLTLIRLAVTGQVRETDGKYTPAVAEA